MPKQVCQNSDGHYNLLIKFIDSLIKLDKLLSPLRHLLERKRIWWGVKRVRVTVFCQVSWLLKMFV